MSNKQSGGGGVGVLTVLGIVFVVLKLCDVIKWSWIWVLAPFWIQFAILICFLFFVGIATLICYINK